jgi:hypothetical protein
MSRYEANGGMPLLSRGPTKEKLADDSNQTSVKEGDIRIDTQTPPGTWAGSEKPISPHRPSASTIIFDDIKKSSGY